MTSIVRSLVQPDRFWQRVIAAGTGCWLWDGAMRPNGYGGYTFWDGERRITRSAHRIAYELYVGPVPDGLELDHLCRVRSCVRPDHLEPVTHAENVRRGKSAERSSALALARTHCRKGHELVAGNVRWHRGSDGRLRRYCIECQRIFRASRTDECVTDGCDKPANAARGLCCSHYKQVRRAEREAA